VKRISKGPVRRIRLRAALAYPAASVALVTAVALVVTSFGPSQVMAPAAAATATFTTAPSATTTTAPSATTTTAPSATTTPNPSPGVIATPTAASSAHHVLARIKGPGLQADYLPVDAPLTDVRQFQTFRVRFELHNSGIVPMTATPRLEYRPTGGASYRAVPEKPQLGIPFHVTREWVPSLELDGGTIEGPLGADIAVANLRIGEGVGLAVNGHHSMGANPDQPITLPTESYTEEEFTIKVSLDAQYLTGYELRITDGGDPLTGSDVATIRLGAPPALRLSPGQLQGAAVVEPPTLSSAGAAYPLLPGQFTPAKATSVSAVYRPNAQTHPLTASTLSAAVYSSSDIHGPYSPTADQCAVCHRLHAAKTPNLLVKDSQSELCLTCHDGLGATTDVQAQYALTRPVNNPVKREYYSHDALAPSTHTQSDLDEFGGVSNRHSECVDCHNSHKAGSTNSVPKLDTDVGGGGWSASGRLAGVSGVSVVNDPTPGAAPAYTFLDGVINPVTREYQLCFKCHSGFTTLTSNAGLKPSQYALDKAVEFNPANASYHPVEAAGTNNTAAMTASLAKTSPYKLWNFDVGSTIRCLNCHASSSTPGPTPDDPAIPPAAADGALQPHTSSNRGILLRNYLDRDLKPRVDTVLAKAKAAYSAGDFALCYVCHGEEPFLNSSSTATNFPLHSFHITALAGTGSGGLDIDTVGAGQGNAICAECHYRIHSTTNKVGTQLISGSRLVNFAPNVKPPVPGGTASWTPPGTSNSGSCSLRCHGKSHQSYEYND